MGNCCPMSKTHGSDSHEGISILFIPLKSKEKINKNLKFKERKNYSKAINTVLIKLDIK
jgi:hypothetical protein